MEQCLGRNCKFNTGFDLPHSKECISDGTDKLGATPTTAPDNSCGPNNIKALNPRHETVQAMGSAEYMKLLVLAMYVLDVEELVITAEVIEEVDSAETVICIANMPDGIHISLVDMEEALELAKKEGGVLD